MIGIINYGIGNIKAFANIYKNFEIPYKIVSKIEDFEGVSKIILPGVGSFDYAMQNLNNSGLREKLDFMVFEEKRPVLGICVGMQMLAESSEEGVEKGLGWISGKVRKFDKTFIQNNPLPHMGWNILDIKLKHPLFNNLDDFPRFYFLHSFYFECEKEDNVLATASYGTEFHCVVQNENIFGIQCHPEKSHHNGIQLLKNFGELEC